MAPSTQTPTCPGREFLAGLRADTRQDHQRTAMVTMPGSPGCSGPLRLALRAARCTPRPGPIWVSRDSWAAGPLGRGVGTRTRDSGSHWNHIRSFPEKNQPFCHMEVGLLRDPCLPVTSKPGMQLLTPVCPLDVGPPAPPQEPRCCGRASASVSLTILHHETVQCTLWPRPSECACT